MYFPGRLMLFTSAGLLSLLHPAVHASPTAESCKETREVNSKCRRTKVAILGAGTAGITAAQALSNATVSDFLIVEYNGEIGGRVKHTSFGKQPNSTEPYTIELGANWVQGLGSPGGPESPIWTLAKKYGLVNTYSNFSGSIKTYNETGATDFVDLQDTFEDDYSTFEQEAGDILTNNLQDRSARAGFNIANWKPKKDPKKMAIEWYELDFEYGQTPEETSQEFAVINYNTTFYQFSDENNFVHDPRGFSAFIEGEASTFLGNSDPRLLLNTIVHNISWTSHGVEIYNTDGSCISADYAICTFSIGVLQHDAVTFTPPLPSYKRTAIETMAMATYTKIFLQFPPDKVFWDTDTQFFLYADPVQRGYYPLFQSLDGPGFMPGSGILFVTVVDAQSYAAEAQDDETTKAQVLEVLRSMFGRDKVPEPTAFLYPRWSREPWAYGSYSNWPPGLTLEMHQNLRANAGRLWFAGEATSAEYYGFLQGAWFEGKSVGESIAECLVGDKSECVREKHHKTLHGTTKMSDLSEVNGWTVSSFLTYGFD